MILIVIKSRIMGVILVVLFGFFGSSSAAENCSPVITPIVPAISWIPVGSSASFSCSCSQCTISSPLRATILVDSTDITLSNPYGSRYTLSVDPQNSATISNATALLLHISSITYADASHNFICLCLGYGNYHIGSKTLTFSVYSGARAHTFIQYYLFLFFSVLKFVRERKWGSVSICSITSSFSIGSAYWLFL